MSKKSKKRQKDYIVDVVIFSVIVLAILGYGLYIRLRNEADGKENNIQTELSINGEDITEAELNMHIDFCKTEVIAKVEEDNIEVSDIDEYIRKSAIDELVRYKVTQSEAKKYGLVNDTDYESFLKNYEAENMSRSEKIASGEIVYGVKEYTLKSYYNYVYSNMKLCLLETLKDKSERYKASEEELSKYYNNHLDSFKAVDNYEFVCYETELEEKANEIYRSLKNGDEVTGGNSIELNEDTYRALSKENPQLYDIAFDMKENEVKQTFVNEKYYILKCYKREDSGYRDFEKYKEEVLDELQRDILESDIDKLVDEAVVKLY